MRWSVLLLGSLLASSAAAFAPAHIVHKMSGRMLSSGRGAVAVSLRAEYVYYEEGPSCVVSLRCKRLRDGDEGPPCRHDRGRGWFAVRPPIGFLGDAEPGAYLNVLASGNIEFADGESCQLDGAVPYFFGVDVPGMTGDFRCHDAGGAETDAGVFGVRTESVGKRFYVFD